MLIEWRGHAFQHDQVALFEDHETNEFDLRIYGRPALVAIKPDHAEDLKRQIRNAERELKFGVHYEREG